jgi:beta-glucanase (GH16 family)
MELYEQRPSNAIVQANAPQPVPAVLGDNEFIGTCHYGINGGASYHSCQRNYPKCLCDGFHTFGVLWDSTHVEYYFDDTLYWAKTPIYSDAQFVTPNINLPENKVAFHSPFFWILNVAVGGAYQGQNINNAIFPTKMLVDYVKVYQSGVSILNTPQKATLMLIRPETAQCRVYSINGKMLGDFSNQIHLMKKGDNVLTSLSGNLPRGVYIMKLTDNGVSTAERIMVTR